MRNYRQEIKRRMGNKNNKTIQSNEPKQKNTPRVRRNSINSGRPNVSDVSPIHCDVLEKRKQPCSSDLLNILHHVPFSTNNKFMIKTCTVTVYKINVYEWILYTCLDFMNIEQAFLNKSDLHLSFTVIFDAISVFNVCYSKKRWFFNGSLHAVLEDNHIKNLLFMEMVEFFIPAFLFFKSVTVKPPH